MRPLLNSVLTTLTMLSSAALLSGCLVPEKFTASVDVEASGAATFAYDGTAKQALAAMAIKEQGSLSAKQENDFRKDAEKTAQRPGVRQFNYLGAGRYQVSTHEPLKPGAKPAVMDVMRLNMAKDGLFTLSSPQAKDKDKQQLKQLGMTIDGTLEVRLPPNAKVISHNASGTPGLLSKAYSWKIGSADGRPTISYQLTGS